MGAINSKAALPVPNVAQTQTWAWIAANNGSYAGQKVMLPSLDGLGKWVTVVWDATNSKWDPDGIQTLASYDLVTGNSGSTTSTLTIPTVAFTGAPIWAKTKVVIYLWLISTQSGCTACPVNMAFGTFSVIADTQATLRRKRFSREIEITSAAVQTCHTKLDNVYSSFTSDNAAGLSGTQNTAVDWNLTADVSTGWVNGSNHVLSMQEYAILWRR